MTTTNANANTITLTRAAFERITNAMDEARRAMVTGACNVRHQTTKDLLDDSRRYLELALIEMQRAAGVEG